ncbi:MAG: right-handed parallel beta-helix repeat-containing protein [Thermoanaerobaculales bacterium]|nr:right-handed parallel beta-helix repeat-containing protein [Thermoanaerobaculales bacterium]
MRFHGHLPIRTFLFAILAIATTLELAGATISVSPFAAEGVVDDNLCSLHEAIAEANTTGTHSGGVGGVLDECMPGSAGADIISLAHGGLYNLTEIDNIDFGGNGLPVIRSVISIYGHSATLRRDPSYVTCDGTYPDFRLFRVDGAGAHLTVDGLTITNGCADASHRGGAIYVTGGARLTVGASTITGNRTAGSDGAGIAVWDGDVITIRASTITENTCQYCCGGGIYIRAGNLVVNSSTISRNIAEDGGGICLRGGTGSVPVNRITLNNSTVSANQANPGDGGGIYSTSDGTTISALTLNSSTVTKNSSGGIFNAGLGAWTYARNSIVADQWYGQDCYNSAGSFQSYGYNIESGTSCGFTAAGDQQLVDPVGLLEFGDHGGGTETSALLADSPAIDAGDPGGCYGDEDGDNVLDSVPFYADQRGSGYWRPIDGNGDDIERCDIGAVEFQMLFMDGFETGDTERWTVAVP